MYVSWKRPRFGLRLLLLLVALVATCLAWWHAAEQRQIAERELQRRHLVYGIRVQERGRADLLQALETSPDDACRYRLAMDLKHTDVAISTMRQKLKELEPGRRE
jgi:hypothetical protein